MHAAAGDQQGLASLLQRGQRPGQFPLIRRRLPWVMQARAEKVLGKIPGLGLHILGQGKGHRAAFHRVCQCLHRSRQAGE